MTKSTPAVAAAQNAFSPLTSDEVNAFAQMPAKKASNSQVKFIQPIPDDAPEVSLKHYKHGEPDQSWAYRNLEGKVLMYVCRKDLPNGKKAIWPICLVENKQGQLKWQSKWSTSPRPILHQEKVKDFDTIFVVEGETTADKAQILYPDALVITFAGGSSSVAKVAIDFDVKGKRFILCPDNDKPGFKAMKQFNQKLLEEGAEDIFLLHPLAFGKNVNEGWDLADAYNDDFTPQQCQLIMERNLQPFPNPYEEGEAQEEDFPYELNRDGVYFKKFRKDGAGHYEKVCSPLNVKARIRDHENGNWGCVLEVVDHDYIIHEIILFDGEATCKTSDKINLLKSKGLKISLKKEDYVLDFIQSYPTDARGRTADRIGWHHNKFITPNKFYGGDDEKIFFQDKQDNKPVFKMAGTMEEWQDNIAKYAIGNSLYIHAICSAMAAPMLKLLNAENTGFHFRGSSSIGKSTILNVACTIYGLRKLVWRSTDNALEAVFANHNHVLLCMDELGQIDQKAAKHIAYLIGNGMGKNRMAQNAIAKKVYEWLLILLSSGEESLQDRMNEDGKGRKQTAGEGVRFIDIRANEVYGTFNDIHEFKSGKQLSEHLNKASVNYHGTAGDAWLEYLTDNMDEATDAAYDLIKQFEDSLNLEDADGQVRRVAVRFANVAAAGELAIEAGILPWPKGEAFNGVKECFESWLNERGSKQATEVINGIDNLKTSIGKYETRNFELWDFAMHKEYTTGNKHDVWGWKKQNAQDDWEFFVTENGFKALTGGFHSRELKEALVNEGLMTLADNGEFKKQYRVPNHGRQRLYHLTPYNQG